MYDKQPQTPDPIKLAASLALRGNEQRCLAAQCIRDLHDKSQALTAENAKLRERVAELEAVRVAVMPRSSTGHPAATHRCGICGGVVQFDGTPPNPECWPAGKKRKEPA